MTRSVGGRKEIPEFLFMLTFLVSKLREKTAQLEYNIWVDAEPSLTVESEMS